MVLGKILQVGTDVNYSFCSKYSKNTLLGSEKELQKRNGQPRILLVSHILKIVFIKGGN